MGESIRVEVGVTIRKLGRSWWLDVCRQGHRDRKNLKTSDQRKALAIARELAASIVAGTWSMAAAGAPLRSIVARYLWSESRQHHAKRTRVHVRASLRRFIGYAKVQGVKTIDAVRRELIEGYIRHRAAERVAPATVNRDRGWIHALLRWALVHGLARVNAASGVRQLRVEQRVKLVLSHDQIAAILPRFTPPMRDLFVFLLNTGLRISEALDVRGADVNLKARTLLVRSPKVHAERQVPINDAVHCVLARRTLAAGAGFVFGRSYERSADADGRLDRHNVARALREAGLAAGVAGVSPHCCRRTFATICAREMSSLALQKLGGWSSPTVVARFYMGAAVMQAPPVIATTSS